MAQYRERGLAVRARVALPRVGRTYLIVVFPLSSLAYPYSLGGLEYTQAALSQLVLLQILGVCCV